MEALLALLRDPTREVQPQDWPQVMQLAELEQVLPYLLGRLRSQGLPRTAEAELEAVRQAFWWSAELKGVLKAMRTAGIEVIPLKGPVLAQRVYGSVALRPAKDLDLLVRSRDFTTAAHVLACEGFAAAGKPDDYHEPWQRGTTRVELHFRLENPLAFKLDMDGLWSRTCAGTFAGVPILRMAPADELLLLCLHGVRHRFERLSHVLDIVLALKTFGLSSLGPARELRTVQELGLAMARQLAPEIEVQVSAQSEALARQLWAELLEREPEPLDWAAQHRFYLQLESSAWHRLRRRIRHTRILWMRLIDADYRFAAKWGVHQKSGVWMLRQFRLATVLLQRLRP